MLSTLFQDIRYSLRQFRKTPGFTITAVAVLALGLGANTAIFSVVDALLLRPLPFRDPNRIAAIFEKNTVGEEGFNSVSPGAYSDWREQATSFEHIGAYAMGPFTIGAADGVAPQRVDGALVARELFPILGVSPLLGRLFTPEEDRYGAPRAAIISHGVWQQRFGGAPEVIGRHVKLDGLDAEIVGVMPAGFAFPFRTTQIWEPIGVMLRPGSEKQHANHFLRVIGRLRPGVTIQQARAEVDGISARYKATHHQDFIAAGGHAVRLRDALVRDTRGSLLILFGAVSCVLLIACVNVANLLLARAAGRGREVSIRSAIGASRRRLVQQLLTESVLLAVVGGALGLMLANAIAGVLAARAPGADAILIGGDLPVDFRVFAFAFAIALVSGVAAGLFPALHFARLDLAAGLRESGRSLTPGRGYGRFRNGLVVAEVALSLVLLAGAGLLLHSFSRLLRVSPGVRIDHTLTMTIPMLEKPPQQILAFLRELPVRLAAIPGVLAAGITTCAPVTGSCSDNGFYIEGRPAVVGQPMDALSRDVSPGFIEAAGVPLLRGRTFSEHDGDNRYAVISQSLAKSFFPGEDPIGKRLRFDADPQKPDVPRFEIIGVVGDILTSLDERPQPTLYRGIRRQVYGGEVYAVMHTAAEPHSVISAARAEVGHADADVAIDQVRTMEDIVGESTSDRRFHMVLFGGFAGLAMVLAAAGLYGVLSYGVSRRRGEIGLRLALGASGGDVRGLILRDGMKPALLGILIGLPAAAAGCQLLKGLLFGIAPIDPVTFAAAPVVLLGVAALASYIPALRAARVDPTVTLRSE